MQDSGAPTDGPLPELSYDDPRSTKESDAERGVVQRQVRALSAGDSETQQSLIRELQKRRALRQATDDTIEQFTVVPTTRGGRTLVLPGELLVARAALSDEIRSELERRGFTERPEHGAECPELTERVARYINERIGPEDLAKLAVSLRQSHVPASANHVTPLAPIVKGEAGPEPSSPSRQSSSAEPAGLPIGVIDTGVAEEKRTDGWLGHDVIQRRPDNIDVLDAFSDTGPPDGLLDFASGHGTFVTAIVQQVDMAADIRVYRAVDSDGIGSEMRLGCAMIRAVREGAKILNLSVGSQTVDDGPPIALQAALDIIEEIDPEVLVIAAAGNYGDTRACWPAAFRRVVAVAAVTAKLEPTLEWSSHGPWVDCSTVGEGITSAYVPGKEALSFDPEPDEYCLNSWAVWSGTSFAAPQVAGAVSLLARAGGKTARQALADLLAVGVTLPDFGRVIRLLPGT